MKQKWCHNLSQHPDSTTSRKENGNEKLHYMKGRRFTVKSPGTPAHWISSMASHLKMGNGEICLDKHSPKEAPCSHTCPCDCQHAFWCFLVEISKLSYFFFPVALPFVPKLPRCQTSASLWGPGCRLVAMQRSQASAVTPNSPKNLNLTLYC